MKIAIIFLGILITIYKCPQQNKQVEISDNFLKYQFVLRLPLIAEEGKVDYLNDSVTLFFNKEFKVYRLPYIYDTIVSTHSDTSLKKAFIGHNYIIFKNNINIGYTTQFQFDSLTLKEIKRDSIFKQAKWYSEIEVFEKPFYKYLKRDTINNKIQICYLREKKVTEFDVDTMYFVYDKHIRDDQVYTFSKHLDTISGFKLSFVKGVFNPFIYKSIKIPEREYKIEAIFKGVALYEEKSILKSLTTKAIF